MAGEPVVVQGTPVSNPSGSGGGSGGAAAAATDFSGKGEKQESRCNDPIFALLFYATFAAILAVAIFYGPAAMDPSTSNSGIDYSGYVISTVILVIISFLFSGLGFMVMMCIPETLIKVSLIFVTVMAGVWCVLAFMSGAIVAGVIGAVFFAISVCYACAVWSRIPFATINMVTSLTAIKANLGVVFYAYFFTVLAGGWGILWAISFAGLFDHTYVCDANGVCSDPNYGYLFLLFVAFFFVSQVIQSCIHVTTAGVVGTWWFEPSETGCCSPAVNNSFIRTITTSFGSVCFGSLIVAILQALRMLANTAQQEGDAGIFACVAECLLACLASLVEYFNKWAFIYVGLYGYSYLQAGKNVFTLFRNRGWEAIIADDLVSNTLFLVSLIVAGITGSIGLAIARFSNLFDHAGEDPRGMAFLLGFLVGLIICSVLLSLVGSGVNAVLVLFAEGPAEFQRNYPELSTRMREVWSTVYPGSI